jgi:tRNA(Ile)-lysidine synthase
MLTLIDKVRRYILEQRLIVPGDRVSVAVSGGADSVALLRALLELQAELGVVLTVAHFNHRIRGDDADADEKFVQNLALRFKLEFYSGSADVPAFAQQRGMSLETAARELRHAWFAALVKEDKTGKVATAHTQDDQAETVLMRFLRGSGTRGLAGISPWQKQKALVRPLLAVTRKEVEAYLNQLRQPWREDSSNRDLRFARNRVRHQLLPLLVQDYNPAIAQTLADLAEVARGEEEFWQQELAGMMARLVRSGKPSRSGRSNREQTTLALDVTALQALPLAIQRRLLRAMGDRFEVAFEFKHVQELLLLAKEGKASKTLPLPGGLEARRSHRELQLSFSAISSRPIDYSYPLPVPGEVEVTELGTTIRARLVMLEGEATPQNARQRRMLPPHHPQKSRARQRPGFGDAGAELSRYNSTLLNRSLLAPELTIRNWRAGDRFFPAHSRFPKKVKELLQPGRLGREVSPAQRRVWPVVESAGQIVWVRGFPAPEALAARVGEAVLIEELTLR